jgi:hypothetical protein
MACSVARTDMAALSGRNLLEAGLELPLE